MSTDETEVPPLPTEVPYPPLHAKIRPIIVDNDNKRMSFLEFNLLSVGFLNNAGLNYSQGN